RAGRKVGAALYLGYGPLTLDKATKTTGFNTNRSAIRSKSATWALTFPATRRKEVEATVALIQAFGTLGSRSRNGWGSLHLTPLGDEPIPVWKGQFRSLDECLALDWPHAIGGDGRPFVWEKNNLSGAQAAMAEWARIKIGLRTSPHLKFQRNNEQSLPRLDNLVLENRHLLSYPVTNHGVAEWGHVANKMGRPRFDQDERLANQIRAKVIRAGIT